MESKTSNSRVNFIPYVTLLASILFGVAGQLLMKWTMSNTEHELFTWSFIQQLSFAISIHALGLINWIFSLRFIKLSIAYPLTSLNYVGILFGSYYLFNEQISLIRILGVLFIFFGVIFVVIPVKNQKSI